MQHVQQMQSCAFFWWKVNIIAAYTGDSDLAIVLAVTSREAEVAGAFLFGWWTSPLWAAGDWPGRQPRSTRPRLFRVLRMTGRSTTARRTRGMARDCCGSAARRRAKRASRGATTKKESGWTRDAAGRLVWGGGEAGAMPTARVAAGRKRVRRRKERGKIGRGVTVEGGGWGGQRGTG